MADAPDILDPEGVKAHPVSKRRRVAVACDACRTRKSRCDGSRPQCSLCRDLGFECIYSSPSASVNVIVQKDHLQGLEGRIKKLEETVWTLKDEFVGLSARVGGDEDHSLQLEQQDEEHRPKSTVPMPDLTGTEDSVDAMGAVTFADEEDSGFFGPSSNIAFLRHLSHAVVQRGYQLSPVALDGGFVNISRPPSPLQPRGGPNQQSQVNIFALPPREETLEAIHQYFTNTGLLFPYIYPPAFLETYHQMAQQNFTQIRRTWLGLLNMVLAMATITAVPEGSRADSRIAESDVFYQRGLGLCGREILRGTTLEVVQFLLLMGQYLQGTQKSIQAWTVHGLAVKAALQLGLQAQNASQSFSLLEQETRKRTWYGCVVLDRTLSMTFGRPAAIPDNYVKLDLPVKHDFETSSSLVDEETSTISVSFFNSTITLYKQLWNVLDRLYGQNVGCDPPLPVSQTVAHIFTMEQQLFDWERSLPYPLQLMSTSSLDKFPSAPLSGSEYFSWKCRVILTLRYLNLRVLLHRPVLVKFITACGSSERNPQDLKFLQQQGMNSMQICAESAMEIIDIVYRVVSEPAWKQSLLGAWWFSLYYTFNAALVMSGTIWVNRDRSVTGSSMTDQTIRAKEYPGRAVTALSKLDDGNRLIDRCQAYLERFNEALNNPEISTSIPGDPDSGVGSDQTALPGGTLGVSPFGIELGEFIADGDILSMLDNQGILSEPGRFPV